MDALDRGHEVVVRWAHGISRTEARKLKNLFEFNSKETRGDKEEIATMHQDRNEFIVQRSKDTGAWLGMSSNRYCCVRA